MQPANSAGLNWIARHNADVTQPWKVEKIDEFPTSHHVAWADLDGDGKKELLNAPLIGPTGAAPTYDQDKASVFWYSAAGLEASSRRQRHPRHHPPRASSDVGRAASASSFSSPASKASRCIESTGSGASMKFEKQLLSPGHEEKAPRLGASDVGVGKQDGKRFFASVEPWHGNEVVVYTENGGAWKRRVIFDKVTSGHEIAVVDLNGDGSDDVIANDNGRVTQQNPNATPGVHVFFAPADAASGEWTYRRIEDKAAMNSCVGADVNGDKRMDVVCTGAGGALRWYENTGQQRK